ncbi:hypothetical protein [Hyalangium minutum]|uniref:hypothetical protein n=1 Tax=Hyalangium minutum TaxID=394096 RepID=UPI0005C66234|nr:hypothetical protein [Hyalangium minutum]
MSRSSYRSQRSAPRPRLLALPLVALCAVVYLGSAAHFALVQHSTCLEHGEILHLEEDGGSEPSQRSEASFTDERITSARLRARIGHGAEAHCSHASLRRESLLPAAWWLAALALQAESGRGPAQDLLLPEPVARLRLAPKSSPPLS